jgi:uncharacterized short protein YbdD (DUF466 family)
MTNNFYAYDERELTPYDRYMLAKRKVSESVKSTNLNQISDAYDEYIREQLRRKTNSGSVMTREEFLESTMSIHKEAALRAKAAPRSVDRPADLHGYGEAHNVWTASARGAAAKKSASGKGGKIMFACYVIIMLALALVIIVRSTGSIAQKTRVDASNGNGESTAQVVSTVDDGTIKPMTVEEDEKASSNWFDELCDNLK